MLPLGVPAVAQVLAHPWLQPVDWEAMLRREAEPPWMPSAAASQQMPDMDLSKCDVLTNELSYDAAKWEPLYREFGPVRAAPWVAQAPAVAL